MVAWPSDFVSTTTGINCCKKKRKKKKRERERDVTAGKKGVAAPDVSSFLATTNGHCARTKEGFHFWRRFKLSRVFQMAGQTTTTKKKKSDNKKRGKKRNVLPHAVGLPKDYK